MSDDVQDFAKVALHLVTVLGSVLFTQWKLTEQDDVLAEFTLDVVRKTPL